MSGIYIHIPFCDTKCIYCDFYSITNHTRKDEFINSLLTEITSLSTGLKDLKFNTIFFGGGTPSLLSKDEFAVIFDKLYKYYDIDEKSEITIEANPGTLNNEKLKEFISLPVNRLSFGVQSFNDNDLKFLSRIHNSQDAIDSIKYAQDAGFNNINIDLIFSVPGQSTQTLQDNLETAVSLGTQHISAYSLIFEEGTFLNDLYFSGKVKKTDIDLERELYDMTIQNLLKNGFHQYEVSNFSKEGYECRHNLKYWQYEDYIGFGPSAASFINRERKVNIRDINKYISLINSNAAAYDFIEKIDYDVSLREYIFLGLRSSGIKLDRFRKLFNFNFTEKYQLITSQLVNNKMALLEDDTFRLLPDGYAICDEIASVFM